MNIDRTIDALFSTALSMGEAEREVFLEARCKGDSELEQRLRALLKAAATSGDVWSERLACARDALWRSELRSDKAPVEDLSGKRIGVWRLERQIARGGLATVYHAQRADGNFSQTAAFKVLRRGLDTDDLVARFRAERQILSTLDHPGVAGILDGGALDDGRPFLVLEYVEGLPITAWCEANDVDIAGRIRLVIAVLDALQHAHRHLIVHRDIKPSNILVSPDAKVSLIDFGIAKLLDPEALPGASTFTRTGIALLTPRYCSPEQRLGRPVTTASDIHQVGQILYELLTGQRPFADEDWRREDMPMPPSRRLRGRPEYHKVRGDLDAITARAMHADPNRRYSSAAEMAEDLQRHLDSRPIHARPDTIAYRAGKLVRRRPWLVRAVGIAFVAIAGYVATITIYNHHLQIEQQRAAAAQVFLMDLLGSPNPYAPADPQRATGITVAEALDLGVARLLDDAYDDDPELRVTLLASIAGVYRTLDEHRKGIDLLHYVLGQQEALYGERSEPVLASLATLAGQYKTIGDYPAATRYYDEQLSRARSVYGGEAPELGVAEVLSADFEISNGRLKSAESLLRAGIPRMRLSPGAYSRPLIEALVDLAAIVQRKSPEEARELLTEARNFAESIYGDESLLAALVYSQMAVVHAFEGEFEQAFEIFSEAAAIHASLVGPDHGETLAARDRLGSVYGLMGSYSRAEEVHRDVLARYLRKYGPRHRGVALSYQRLATAVARQERYAEAISLHEQALASYHALLGDGHPILAEPLLSIAEAQLQQGDLVAAELSSRKALELLEQTEAEHRLMAIARCYVASIESRSSIAGIEASPLHCSGFP